MSSLNLNLFQILGKKGQENVLFHNETPDQARSDEKLKTGTSPGEYFPFTSSYRILSNILTNKINTQNYYCDK